MSKAINYQMKVLADKGLRVRKTASTDAAILGTLADNTLVTATIQSGDWMYITAPNGLKGWAATRYDGTQLLQFVKDLSGKLVAKSGGTTTATSKNTSALESQYRAMLSRAFTPDVQVGEKIERIDNLLNMPYQYMENVDTRHNGNAYGRRFMETIINDLPICTITPGLPKFLPKSDRNQEDAVIQSLLSGNNKIDSIFKQISNTNKDFRYYTFDPRYSEYIEFVEALIRQSAAELELDKYLAASGEGKMIDQYRHIKLGEYNKKTNEKSIIKNNRNIHMYVDVSTSHDEDASNETTQSALASGLKGISDTTKEAQFVLGAGLGYNIDPNNVKKYNEVTAELVNAKIKDQNSIVGRVSNLFDTYKQGGNMIFPEIWRESQYSKRYTVTVKLKTPYGHPLAVFWDVLVPFYHLLALVLPRGLTANSYVSPFLVRMFVKGAFHVEMGIVDSISFRKAGNGSEWTVDSLPTDLEVTLSIRDLYPALFMSRYRNYELGYFSNIQLIDFIATMSGVNLSESTTKRKIEIAKMNLQKYSPAGLKKTLTRQIDDKVGQMLQHLGVLGEY